MLFFIRVCCLYFGPTETFDLCSRKSHGDVTCCVHTTLLQLALYPVVHYFNSNLINLEYDTGFHLRSFYNSISTAR